MITFLYLLLSFISSLLELGSVLVLATFTNELFFLLCGALAYQAGNLFVRIVCFSPKLRILFLALALISYILSSRQYGWIYLSIFFANSSLQALRRDLSEVNEKKVSTFNKRLVRIAGFLVAGLVTYYVLGIVLILVLVIGIGKYSLGVDSFLKIVLPQFRHKNVLSFIMVMHQSHYFSYAYLLLILLVNGLDVPQRLVGPIFIVGWLSYAAAEKIFNHFNLLRTFIIGHILVSISLAVLGYFYNSLPIVLIAWFASGFGGGTVFCLTRLNQMVGKELSVDMEIWEDSGHLLGTLIPIVLAVIFYGNYSWFFLVSSGIAFVTAVIAGLNRGKIEGMVNNKRVVSVI